MPSRPRQLPAVLGDVFSVRDAIRVGVSPRRLRHRALAVPFHGVRMTIVDPVAEGATDESPLAAEARERRSDIARRARAYASKATSHAFFIGVTAAVLWRLPLPLRVLRPARAREGERADAAASRDIDVAVHAPHRAPRGRSVHGRRLSSAAAPVRESDGLRLSSPAAVWAELATVLSIDELIALGDAVVHVPRVRGMTRGAPDSGLGTAKQLEASMNTGRRPGVAKLRAALPQIRVGVASPAETEVRLAVLRAGLPEPELDYDVYDADGRPIGYTELAYPRWRILIEREGDHHRTDRRQWYRDIEKHAACAAAGWTVIRLTSRHMHPTSASAVTLIRDALVRAGWRP
ncbi:hypothetical protein [Microbacterium allomyrinae]|uniref:DUF559 domain-containing protein n=1 Tax=Microbacterium allomyrinae TaxID=2830666 RepID=A0A9X1S183_9MICO|nr:hypothetical protein [Microbacterium allomyrinae]MCC2031406.1 hypothetical protein [Microbacterium allomyrinae]